MSETTQTPQESPESLQDSTHHIPVKFVGGPTSSIDVSVGMQDLDPPKAVSEAGYAAKVIMGNEAEPTKK